MAKQQYNNYEDLGFFKFLSQNFKMSLVLFCFKYTVNIFELTIFWMF